MEREWWTPLTGVLFVLLAIAGFIVAGEPPDADDPLREIVSFYRDNDDQVMVGALLQGIAASSLVFFAGILRGVLRRAEGPNGVLSLVAFAGAAFVALSAAIDATLSFTLAETVEDIGPESTRTLLALWNNDFMPFAVGMQVMFLAVGLSTIRHGALPKWLGWIAIVIGVVAVSPVGFFAFLAAAIWIVVVSVLLVLRARASGSPTELGSAGV